MGFGYCSVISHQLVTSAVTPKCAFISCFISTFLSVQSVNSSSTLLKHFSVMILKEAEPGFILMGDNVCLYVFSPALFICWFYSMYCIMGHLLLWMVYINRFQYYFFKNYQKCIKLFYLRKIKKLLIITFRSINTPIQ